MDSRRGGNDDVEADVSDHNSVASTKSAPVVDRYDHPEIATTRTVDANARAGVVVSVDRRGEDTGARASPGAETAGVCKGDRGDRRPADGGPRRRLGVPEVQRCKLNLKAKTLKPGYYLIRKDLKPGPGAFKLWVN
jgi:hypothetical protein